MALGLIIYFSYKFQMVSIHFYSILLKVLNRFKKKKKNYNYYFFIKKKRTGRAFVSLRKLIGWEDMNIF